MSESTPSSSSALLTRLLQFDVNPVWVKDLRQASRSWTVTGTLLLMLLVFYLISLGAVIFGDCLLYTSPSPRDGLLSRMPSSA